MSATVWRADSALWAPEWEAVAPQPAIVRVARAVVLCSVLSLIFIAEYSQGTSEATSKSFLYGPLADGFRVIDAVVLVLAMVHGLALGCSRKRRASFPRNLALLMLGFGMAIVISLVYGMERGGQNFFFDWRALALGVAFYMVYRFWIQNPANARTAIAAFGAVAAVHMAILFLAYAQGRGASLLGLRIPLFDGPSLSALVLVSILGLSLSGDGLASQCRWPWLLLSAGAMLLVALCFRRSYWAELAIGVALLALVSRGRRQRILATPLCVAGIAFLVLGASLPARLSSIDFTRVDAPYSEDNADHVGDVLDAWVQVRAAPLMGIGLGRSYPTWHIRNWKEESVMVHNAPLHVWLKYGLLGLGFYFAYHLYLFRYLYGQTKRAPPSTRAVVSAVLAYLAAQFIVSLGFTPWPYSAVQSTNLIAFLLAIALVREPVCPCLAFPSSPLASTGPLTWKTQS
jgi:hypothetical protein